MALNGINWAAGFRIAVVRSFRLFAFRMDHGVMRFIGPPLVSMRNTWRVLVQDLPPQVNPDYCSAVTSLETMVCSSESIEMTGESFFLLHES